MEQDKFTAWDGKQYPWPPPEGWVMRDDGRWWSTPTPAPPPPAAPPPPPTMTAPPPPALRAPNPPPPAPRAPSPIPPPAPLKKVNTKVYAIVAVCAIVVAGAIVGIIAGSSESSNVAGRSQSSNVAGPSQTPNAQQIFDTAPSTLDSAGCQPYEELDGSSAPNGSDLIVIAFGLDDARCLAQLQAIMEGLGLGRMNEAILTDGGTRTKGRYELQVVKIGAVWIVTLER